MLEPVLLLLLRYGPAHGYTLLGKLGGFGLGEPDPSVLYRALRGMESQGWVCSTWDEEETQGPPRRVYSITRDGDAALARWVEDLERGREQIDALLREYSRHVRAVGGDNQTLRE